VQSFFKIHFAAHSATWGSHTIHPFLAMSPSWVTVYVYAYSWQYTCYVMKTREQQN